MKKIVIALCAVMALFVFVGCKKDVEVKNVEGSLEEIMAKVYENSGLENLPMTMNTEVTDENKAYMLGSAEVTYKEALASEAAISAIAHSVVLVRTNEGEDIEALKTKIRDNVNGRKWICVGVEDENIIVDNIGDLVILIMSNDSEAIHNGFLKLKD